MKVGRFCLLGVVALALGCGGSGSSSRSSSIEPGFYRGTFSISSDGWINGSAPMFIDYVNPTNLAGEAKSGDYYVSVRSTSEGASIIGTATVTGDLSVTKLNDGFSFTFSNGSGVTATGELSPAQLPVLGSSVSIPAEGNWVGEMLVVTEGRVRSFATVTATVDASGSLVANCDGGGSFLPDGVFTGKFESDGTLSDAMILSAGNFQSHNPAYSNDGTTIVVRYGPLESGDASYWLTLREAQPVP